MDIKEQLRSLQQEVERGNQIRQRQLDESRLNTAAGVGDSSESNIGFLVGIATLLLLLGFGAYLKGGLWHAIAVVGGVVVFFVLLIAALGLVIGWTIRVVAFVCRFVLGRPLALASRALARTLRQPLTMIRRA